MTYRKLSNININNYSKDPYNLHSYYVENFIPIVSSAKTNVVKTENKFNINSPAIIASEVHQSQQLQQMMHQQQHQEIEDPYN